MCIFILKYIFRSTRHLCNCLSKVTQGIRVLYCLGVPISCYCLFTGKYVVLLVLDVWLIGHVK